MPRMPKPRRRIALLAALTAMAAIGLSVPAHGLNPDATLGASKHKDGPFVAQAHVKIDVGSSRDVYFKATSFLEDPQDLKLQSFATERPAYKVTWFKGRHDITDEVRGAGYEFSLGPHRKKLFRVHVKRKQGHDATCVDGAIYTPGNTFVNSAAITVDNNNACI
jgi:hypothetical protein